MKVVVLTGAGISAESGLGTYRGTGVQEQWDPAAFSAELASNLPAAHRRRVRLLRAAQEAEPNAAHRALADLGRHPGIELTVITQNLDDLHERAGSSEVVHLHGELAAIRHRRTGKVRAADADAFFNEELWRPHVVGFGERVLEMDRCRQALAAAEVFFSVGTSLQVPPASMFPAVAAGAGAVTIELNRDPTGSTPHFSQSHRGLAGELVPELVEQLLRIQAEDEEVR